MKMIALSMLVLSACAGPSANMRSPASEFAGPWHGVLSRGEARSPADFRFSASDGGYQGFFWGQALMPIVLRDVHLGRLLPFPAPHAPVRPGLAGGQPLDG